MRLRGSLAVLVVVGTAAWVVASSLASSSDHGSEFWAGQWTTSTGGVAWRAFDEGDLENAKNARDAAELFNKLPCKSGPRFYRGGYTAGGDRGKIMGCGTATSMRGRWMSNIGGQFQNGSYTIQISSRNPLKFKGTFRQDDGVSGPYTGTWSSHFDGDGCCPDDDGGENAAPSNATRRVQSDLQKLGFYNGPLDGRDSERTKSAVKQFQRKVGITVDGKCGARCQKALKLMLEMYDPKSSVSAAPASPRTVTELQENLKKLGFFRGPLDGRYDAETIDAVKRFQRDAGIPADGKCERRCQLALVRALT